MKRVWILSVLLTVTLLLSAWAAGQAVEVGQRNRAFSQSSVNIKVGEAVRFVNDDSVTHNVFAVGEGFSFNLKRQAPGNKTEVSFAREGTYVCRCAIHPNMKLEVHVTK